MNITTAQYIADFGDNSSIRAVIDEEEIIVPLDPNNRHYAEIMRQVNEGTLTIADAE
jgi:hypothetical protein